MFNKKANSRFYFDILHKFFAKSKRSQGEVITTVLIILLVLAAIVIVWQVVQSTVKSGAEQVEKQSSCIGISMDVTAVDYNTITIKRIGGRTLTGTNVVYIEGGNSTTNSGLTAGYFNEPMTSINVDTINVLGNLDVEVGLKLSDVTVCPVSGKVKTPAAPTPAAPTPTAPIL